MPGRRGERRRPVTALTTGRWAATLLTLALLSPLAGVAHGSGEPAPAPSRAHSHPARTSTRRARRDTRARCPSCAEGWSPGASTRSTTRWCCATTRWRRTPPPRRTPRSARAPPSSAPGSYSSTATGTPPRTPRPPRGNVERTKNVNRPNSRAPPPSFTRRGRHHRQSQANSETTRHRGGVHARVQARARLLDRGRGAANLVAILRLAHHSSESRRRDGPLRVGSARRRAGAQDPPTIPRRTTNPSGGVEAVREDR